MVHGHPDRCLRFRTQPDFVTPPCQPGLVVVFKSRTDASVVNLIVSLAEKTSLAKARPIAATVALP